MQLGWYYSAQKKSELHAVESETAKPDISPWLFSFWLTLEKSS
jgi:hypothetical protein